MARLSRLFVAALMLAPATAAAGAGVFRLYGEARVGGEWGKGLAGDQKDVAFSAKRDDAACTMDCSVVPALGYGAVVGGRFLILDGNIKHTQYRASGELSTWTQFNAGLALSIDLGTEQDKKAFKSTYFEVGAWLGFGVGTGQQVDPPLDSSEISDKGFMLEGQVGFGKHINKILDIGVVAPMSWGYLFKSGAANDTSNQYQALQIEVLLTLRANIRFI